MIAWMLYAAALSLLITGIARACAAVCALYRIPTRWCWLGALALSVAAPLAARSAPERVQGNTLRLTTATYRLIETVSDAPRSVATSSAAPLTTDAAISVVWAAASAALLLALIAAGARLRVARRSWRGATVCGERVLISADSGPAVAGLLRPLIVLPAWALELGDPELALAVAHEREHINARDPWLLLVSLLVVVLVPWNAALWLQLRQLRRAIEGDCDARVLARTGDARRYAGLLITVVQRRGGAHAPVLALSYPTSILEWRIRTMTNRTPSFRPARAAALATLAGALVAAVTVLPRPGMSQNYSLARRGLAGSTPVSGRASADTVKSAQDSTLAALAATRDTLARLRSQMVNGTATVTLSKPGSAVTSSKLNGNATVRIVEFQLPLRDTSAKARAARAMAMRNRAPRVPLTTIQAAIASRFPGAASVVTAPGHERVFTFLVRADGSVEDASVSTDSVTRVRSFDTKLQPDQIESVQVMKKVPIGRDSASVVWIVRK